jgi:hypothetical protein
MLHRQPRDRVKSRTNLEINDGESCRKRLRIVEAGAPQFPAHQIHVRRKPSTNRALCIMLVRPRISEIGKYAVAHVLGDKPAIALDQFGAAAMVASDNATLVFGGRVCLTMP